MANIGTFTRQGEDLVGEIRTLTLKAKASIKPVAKSGEQAPDHRVFSNGVEIGAGWSMISKTSNKPYVKIKLDDPSFAAAIYCRLIETPEGQVLVWSR